MCGALTQLKEAVGPRPGPRCDPEAAEPWGRGTETTKVREPRGCPGRESGMSEPGAQGTSTDLLLVRGRCP